MARNDDEEERLRSVALQNARSINLARERAEEALRKQSEWLRITLASIGDAVISTDAKGRVTFMNGVAETLTGWTQNEARERPLPEIFHIVNEQTRLPVEHPALRALREGTIMGLANHTVLISRDGTERPIEDSAAPIRDDSGALVGTVLVFRDVSERRRAEDAVRAANERASAILESINEGFVVLDAHWRFVYVNAAFERMNNVRREDIIGRNHWETYPATVGTQLETEYRKVAATGVTAEFENYYPPWDRWFALKVYPAQGGGLCIQVRDVTQAKRAEMDLRQSEEHLRAVVDTTPACIKVVRADGTLLDMNASGLAILDAGRPEDVKGKSVYDFISEEFQNDYRAFHERICQGEKGSFEFEIVGLCGTRRRMEAHAAPLKGPDGTFLHLAISHDITDRKKAADALRDSEVKFRQLAETIPQLAWMARPDGHIFWYNRRWFEYTGCTADQMEGWGWQSVHDPDVLPRVLERWRGSIASGEPFEMVFPLKRADGLFCPFLTRVNPLRNDAGQILYWFGTNTDINEQKRAESLLQLQKDTLELLVQGKPLVDVLDVVARSMETHSTHKVFAAIHLLDDSNSHFGLTIAPSLPSSYAQATHGMDVETRTGPCCCAVLDGQSVIVRDVAGDSRWKAFAEFALPLGLRSGWSTPIKSSAQRIVGTFANYYDQPGEPSPEDLALMEVLVRTVALAIEHDEANRAKARLAAIVESSDDAIISKNLDGVITSWNVGAERLFGYSANEAIGRPVTILMPPDRFNEESGILESIRCGKSIVHYETVRVRKDGSLLDISLTVSPVKDGTGRIVGASKVSRNITDRRRAEELLRASENRLRLAQSIARIGTFDWNIQTGVNSWTPELEAIYGLKAGEFGQTQPAFERLVHPDDRAGTVAKVEEAIRTGQPTEHEWRIVWSDRSVRWVAGRFQCFKDTAGEPLRLSGVNIDITERKQAEQRTRFLADASTELAVVVDYESTLQKVANLAVPYFADWSAVDLADDEGNLRRLAVAHQDPDKVTLVRELMREYPPDPQSPFGAFEVLRTGKPEIVPEIPDDLLIRQARSERHLRLIRSLGLKSYICVPLIVSGKTLGLLTFATAESGRKYTDADLALAIDLAHRAAVAVENTQLYQALRETDRRKDEFLATLAHELRNPLAPVRNALQILKMPRLDLETMERSRSMMERQVHHLVRLVDDLLDVSRVMRGKIELRKEPVELATVVARAVELVQPLVDTQGHRLSVHIARESLLLDADPVRLTQVIGNLLTNAAKYTEQNGRIWLTAKREGEMAVVRIRDNGIGIAPSMVPRIFELFVQADHTSTKTQGGLGIGLTLVKNLVEMHNGIVQARSKGLGKGSEFIVRLPISAQGLDPNHGGQAVQQAQTPISPSGYRVLIVDDNQDGANSLAMLLKMQGHEVRVAFSGMAAVEMTKTYTPDVVFMDIGMPGMDGYEAARRIRQQPGFGKVVMAALTGWGQQEDRRRTAEAGFDHHLVKPLDPTMLESFFTELRT